MDSESILARLNVSRIRLRSEPERDGSLDAIDSQKSGRYEVLGKIAAGGIGQILKAQDGDIGRDVALKVLRPTHLANPELVRRFVEEAQIGGQLQHPGIVPVFELGLQADERPFFAMRLVKGRTLAALLTERRNAGGERRRLLTVFQQVCQTMAYAHSRGVIHRDLKPSNIMVGAFGEVQVVDWGFAKVIAQGGVADERRAREAQVDVTRIQTVRTAEGSESLAGSVMGTPAYMPPEQALGQVDDLDERSDVFSLGAILCEILTGAPPYTGSRDELLTAASQGRVRIACARLDACKHDPQLTELAKQCLSPIRQQRPRQAGALAEQVEQHLARAGERAQKAQLAAIEARRSAAAQQAAATEEVAAAQAAAAEAQEQNAKTERAQARSERAQDQATEETRARRRVMAVAAALLLAAIVGGGGWEWIQSSADELQLATARDVDSVLEQAVLDKGARRWEAALVSVRQANQLAADADPETRKRVESVRTSVLAAKSNALAAEQRVARHNSWVDELTEIRLGQYLDPATTADQLAAAFTKFGIPLTTEAFRKHPEIAADLSATLDDWAHLPGAHQPTLHGISSAIDDDPVRIRIRRGEMPGRADLGKLPPATFALMSAHLLATGKFEEAVEVLRLGQARHPDHLWINIRFARALETLPRPRRSEATVILACAQALRPNSAAIARIEESLRVGSDDLSEFRGQVDYLDRRQWHSFEVHHSSITDTKRRIYFNKRRVTDALLRHKGGREWTAAPLEYEANTVFVAETLNANGDVADTHALRIRSDLPAEFLIFGGDGRYAKKTEKGLGSRQSCISCHTNTGEQSYHDPMMSYPKEPQPMRLLIDDEARDMGAVVHFLEAYHRGGRVFGPYGAIWIGKLRADARNGRISDADRPYYRRLKEKYPKLMAD